MQRRSHKKSRGGCSQCKKRHVKCDERRPACRLCEVSDQTCSFKDKEKCASADGRGDNHKSSSVARWPPSLNTLETARLATDIFPQSTSLMPVKLENAVNLKHMELLLHFFDTKDLFSLGDDRGTHQESLTVSDILSLSIRFPYLLHQILAFCARHLATLHPFKAGPYLYQATALQTRAISLFNSAYATVTQATCVPILLFSTVLGHHVFTDTLCKRHKDDLEDLLNDFVQCLYTLKGVYVIYKEARPFWQSSMLDDILSRSSSLTSRAPVGARCQRVKDLVSVSKNLSSTEKEVCKEAIRYLEIGFDALLAVHEEPGNRYQMLFLWCVLVPIEYIALIAAKNTEALMVFGHYAVLLRHGEDLWQVRDAGEYILGLLRAHLINEEGVKDWIR